MKLEALGEQTSVKMSAVFHSIKLRQTNTE